MRGWVKWGRKAVESPRRGKHPLNLSLFKDKLQMEEYLRSD